MPPYTLHGYNQGGMYGYGSPVIWGGVQTYTPMTTPPVIPPSTGSSSDAKPADTTKPTDTTKPVKPMGANLKFQLPTDANLYIDGQLVKGSGSERSFRTPPLATGQKFFYDVKAEFTVNGSMVSQEMRVIVESGANINETFTKLIAAVQGTPTAVAGR